MKYTKHLELLTDRLSQANWTRAHILNSDGLRFTLTDQGSERLATLEAVLKPFLRRSAERLSKKAAAFLWSEWRPTVAELRPPPFCRGEIAALITLVTAHLNDPDQFALPAHLTQNSITLRRPGREEAKRNQFLIKPNTVQSSAIATIRTALGLAEECFSDSEIVHLVLATGLARLEQTLDGIMQDGFYTVAEGFEGFECSDERTRQAIERVRRHLAGESSGEAWKGV